MPEGKLRSRTLRRVFVKTPGGKTTLQHRNRKPSAAVCGNCGATLKGVPREIPSELKKLPKTSRRPERPYGGVLCSRCTRQLIKEQARAISS